MKRKLEKKGKTSQRVDADDRIDPGGKLHREHHIEMKLCDEFNVENWYRNVFRVIFNCC